MHFVGTILKKRANLVRTCGKETNLVRSLLLERMHLFGSIM